MNNTTNYLLKSTEPERLGRLEDRIALGSDSELRRMGVPRIEDRRSESSSLLP
jgi:hypothetical protein